jgi:mono/diheme cytochrome c family protein
VRIETLIITSHSALVRPPREVPLAIAAWLRTLAPPAPPPTSGRGAELFAARCARCHVPPAFAGPPVSLAEVGTDARVGLSADRGTGGYRVPSLRGVASRGRLLHDASVPNVATLLDPARSVAGHPFSFDLPAADRAALAAFVATL